MEEDMDGYTGNGLTLDGPPFRLEKIYDYESGGHHPVHLDDCLGKDGRYRVLHNLEMVDALISGFVAIWNV